MHCIEVMLFFFAGFTMYATCLIWLSFVLIFAANPSKISLKVSSLFNKQTRDEIWKKAQGDNIL